MPTPTPMSYTTAGSCNVSSSSILDSSPSSSPAPTTPPASPAPLSPATPHMTHTPSVLPSPPAPPVPASLSSMPPAPSTTAATILPAPVPAPAPTKPVIPRVSPMSTRLLMESDGVLCAERKINSLYITVGFIVPHNAISIQYICIRALGIRMVPHVFCIM
jgi:hypothetical protein